MISASGRPKLQEEEFESVMRYLLLKYSAKNRIIMACRDFLVLLYAFGVPNCGCGISDFSFEQGCVSCGFRFCDGFCAVQ